MRGYQASAGRRPDATKRAPFSGRVHSRRRAASPLFCIFQAGKIVSRRARIVRGTGLPKAILRIRRGAAGVRKRFLLKIEFLKIQNFGIIHFKKIMDMLKFP